jgi:hypothetical protein
MNLRKVTIQLKNGLKITFSRLTPKAGRTTYKRYLLKFEAKPRILGKDMYKATFNFKTAKLCAFCYDDAVSLIISLFGNYSQTRALYYFECFVINGHVVHNSSFSGGGSQFLALLKQSVVGNISPNLTALLALKMEGEKKVA